MTNEELWKQAREGNKKAEDQLVRSLMPYLLASAREYNKEHSYLDMETEDLLQEACIACVKAVRTFDPEKGYLFRTYASRAAENAMKDYARRCRKDIPPTGPMIYLDDDPLSDDDEDDISYYDLLISKYTKTPEEVFFEKLFYLEIHQVLDRVSLRESSYLRYRYGFDDDLLHSREETAEHFHLSSNRAENIEQDALQNAKQEYLRL